jgi:hypothetical protein
MVVPSSSSTVRVSLATSSASSDGSKPGPPGRNGGSCTPATDSPSRLMVARMVSSVNRSARSSRSLFIGTVDASSARASSRSRRS